VPITAWLSGSAACNTLLIASFSLSALVILAQPASAEAAAKASPHP
jgi:hypothetical protein